MERELALIVDPNGAKIAVLQLNRKHEEQENQMEQIEKERYVALTDRYLKQRSAGKMPEAVTGDLRFCLKKQEERLRAFDISMHEEYAFQDGAITGAVESSQRNSRSPFRGFAAFRETVRTTEFCRNEKKVFHRQEPVTFYSVIVDKKGSGDVTVNCPNCGAAALASKLQEGCPYCGTCFKMSELFPRISSCYATKDVVERVGMEERIKSTLKKIGAAIFVILLLFCFLTDKNAEELPVWFLILKNVFLSAISSAALTFFAYLFYSFFLMGKLFAQLGSVMPMVGTASSQNRLKKQMEKWDPFFFIRIFEGKLVSLMQAILFSDDRKDLSIYEGDDDLSAFDDLIDMDYRGAFKLKQFGIRERRVSVLLEVFTENTYAGKHFRRRNERMLVRMERSADAVTDTGFSIHAVSCEKCGGSFDAMHVRNCPFCGAEYHAAESDWVITEIRKK